jgi:hypothetical protein
MSQAKIAQLRKDEVEKTLELYELRYLLSGLSDILNRHSGLRWALEQQWPPPPLQQPLAATSVASVHFDGQCSEILT